jgi:hypothetical protein
VSRLLRRFCTYFSAEKKARVDSVLKKLDLVGHKNVV